MTTLAEIRAKSGWRDIIEGQPQHIGIALLMTVGACSLLSEPENAKPLLGLTVIGWAKLSIALALIHQFIVAFVFRLQLHKNLMTRLFGEHDMQIWRVIFLPLLAARPITLILIGWADATPITDMRIGELVLGAALLAPAIWGMHSTLVHFTLPRALGGDHFRDEFLAMPMVTKGVFKYTDNGMYGVVFLGLWGIALLFGSWNALIIALFQQSYIWVHMYCTEAPDLRRMFPPNPD
jgi:protein-S-isoprenylcysteine O-methyltransferase Ste14